jgi:hypothetical protein
MNTVWTDLRKNANARVHCYERLYHHRSFTLFYLQSFHTIRGTLTKTLRSSPTMNLLIHAFSSLPHSNVLKSDYPPELMKYIFKSSLYL